MKPSEIIPIDEIDLVGHSHTLKTLNRYFDEDCVVSYVKNSYSVIFLIKGKVKPFAFAYIDEKLSPYYYSISLIENISNYFNLFEKAKCEEKLELVDEKLLQKVKAKIMLQEIKA